MSVTLVDRKKEGLIPYIQKKAGVNFERIGAPQPAQMAQIAGTPMTCYCVIKQESHNPKLSDMAELADNCSTS